MYVPKENRAIAVCKYRPLEDKDYEQIKSVFQMTGNIRATADTVLRSKEVVMRALRKEGIQFTKESRRNPTSEMMQAVATIVPVAQRTDTKHLYRTGKIPSAKMQEEDAANAWMVLTSFHETMSLSKTSRIVGKSIETVSRIISGYGVPTTGVTEEMKQYITGMKESGMKLREIAEKTGLSIARVSVITSHVKALSHRMAKENVKKVLSEKIDTVKHDYYETKMSLSAIAKKYGTTAVNLKSFIVENNFAIRKTPRAHYDRIHLPVRELLDLKEAGFSYLEISKMYNTVPMTVRRHILRANPNPRLLPVGPKKKVNQIA